MIVSIRCNCCKRDYSPTSRPFTGKIIYGWLSEFTDKLITEGKPVAIAFCKDCIDSGKVEIPVWSSFAMPIHVKSNSTSFIVDFANANEGPVKSATCEADRARAAAPPQETQDCPAGHRKLDDVPARDPRPTPALVESPPAAAPVEKPPEPTIPGGTCSKCGKEITYVQSQNSNNTHGILLCKECEAVETARVIQIMRDNEAAGRPLTDGLGGSTKAVAFCVGTGCGGLVNANDKKASRLFFGKTLCKACIEKEKAARGGKL